MKLSFDPFGAKSNRLQTFKYELRKLMSHIIGMLGNKSKLQMHNLRPFFLVQGKAWLFLGINAKIKTNL